MPPTESLTQEPLLVACLCAEWCGVCRDYAPQMVQTLAGFDASAVCMVWVDIEDHAAVLGDLDVENFPTLLIARGDVALFFGTITPQPRTLQRLVETALAGDLPRLPQAPDLRELVVNVQAFRAARD